MSEPAIAQSTENLPRRHLPPGQVASLLECCATASAVTSASELGVFECLSGGPVDARSLARECGITERGAEVLLSALASLGLATAAGDGRYRAAAAGLEGLRGMVEPWAELARALRGEWRQAEADTLAGSESLYPELVEQLGHLFGESAERAADILAMPNQRVLDVGAGAAPWSLALAARSPGCLVTAVDLPLVLPSTRRAVQMLGREAQFRILPGDIFAVDWGEPESYDLALAANVLHLFAPTSNGHLLARLFAALRRGGSIAVIDIVPDENGDGPRAVALYSLGLLLRTATGRAYRFSTYQAWLRKAGFEGIERHTLQGALPFMLITARRPR